MPIAAASLWCALALAGTTAAASPASTSLATATRATRIGTYAPSTLLYRPRARTLVLVEDTPSGLALHELDRTAGELRRVVLSSPYPAPATQLSANDSLAYDPRDDSYLVLWGSRGTHGPTAQGFTADGRRLGPAAKVAALAGRGTIFFRGLVYDPRRNTFLLVAGAHRPAPPTVVCPRETDRAERLTPSAQAIGSVTRVAAGWQCSAVAVAADPRTGGFLMTSVRRRGQAVETDAIPLAASGRPAGPPITVDKRAGVSDSETLAFAPAADAFVLVVESASDSADSLLVWRLDSHGRATTRRVLVRAGELNADVSLYAATIAAERRRDELLVVWYALTGLDSAQGTHFEYVRARRLAARSLAPIGPLVRLARVHSYDAPVGAYDAALGRYLVVWTRAIDGALFGRFVTP